jgi:hypothetical protein
MRQSAIGREEELTVLAPTVAGRGGVSYYGDLEQLRVIPGGPTKRGA